jgi:hypothetical protein
VHRDSQEDNGVKVSGKETVLDEKHTHLPCEGLGARLLGLTWNPLSHCWGLRKKMATCFLPKLIPKAWKH